MVEKRDKVELSWPTKKRHVPGGHNVRPVSIEVVERHALGSSDKTRVNVLFWGDNLSVLRHLLAQQNHLVDMIYIDPPFFSGGNFSIRAPGGKFPRAYKDSWQDGIAQYLGYMHERLLLMHELLRDGGSMYVHLDWHAFHYVKVMLDEIFGYENFRNQIVWKRLTYKQTQVKAYGVLHDVILYYTKGKNYTWNDVRAGYGDDRVKKYFCWLETPDGRNTKLTKDQLEGTSPIPEGRRFALNPVINPNPNRPNLTYEFLGFTRVWKYTRAKMEEYLARGIVFQPSPGVLPQKKQYLDESDGMKLNDLFLDIGAVMGGSNERLDYDTQKPLKLLERLIRVSTNPGDTVADFFSGSGTTLDAASRLGRRWIGCELARPGINMTRRRLLARRSGTGDDHNDEGEAVDTPFTVNKVSSQVELDWLDDPRTYARVVLSLYGAESDGSSGWNVGEKAGRTVVVAPAAAPTTLSSAAALVEEIRARSQRKGGVDVLSRDWALRIGENPSDVIVNGIDANLVQVPTANEISALLVGTGINMEEIARQKIPPAINGIVPFHALPDLSIGMDVVKGMVSISLNGYSSPGTSHSALDIGSSGDPFATVDYIGIDWDHDGQVFSDGGGFARSRRSGVIVRAFTHQYAVKGSHTILIRVIDAFGHETSRIGRVDVFL